jgi:hypothetical protein
MSKNVAFVVADNNNMKYAKMMINSLRKWHTEEELPVVIVNEEKIASYNDDKFFYRATPVVARELSREYDLVLKLDADQIITGDLNHILNDESFDVAVVSNINRIDPPVYGYVSFASILPDEYYNCGLVAMRNKDFIRQWYNLCFSKHFIRCQYGEQDLLNVLCHYGPFKVRILDLPLNTWEDHTWNGLIAKGEGMRMEVEDGKLVLPKADDNYPSEKVVIKAYHWAGGNSLDKMNYRLCFPEPVVDWVDWLVSDKDKPYEK